MSSFEAAVAVAATDNVTTAVEVGAAVVVEVVVSPVGPGGVGGGGIGGLRGDVELR